MNIAKNMEFIFLGAVALISATGFATAAAPLKNVAPAPAAIIVKANVAEMPVVTVKAKRLTAAEKAAL
ncbi:hypothetical protein GTP41_18605 [Pseudoduganella sp. DS3]|uniref:Uncharacterized protein n=1 Tax=Pseudoduganella guangdongensis TaxID=2692179 RepID=A0A6N9HLH9_9BURK|nr:hypothetical protein [Pseudoduganella guangdongensis]MYN04107.1 hypothetical protein [Pseudoduganella guangdongensis]